MIRALAGEAPALALILAGWALAIATCTGLGALWQRAFRDPRRGVDRLFMAFWCGLALAMAALQLWHFFLPVGAAAGLLLLGAGALGLWRGELRASIPRLRGARPLAALALASAATLYLAHRSLRPLEHYDTGLYFLGALAWIREEALVPGLANLHGRFGFNNSHLLLAALFDLGPWQGRAPHLFNGALVSVFVAQCLHAGMRCAASRAERASAAFAWLLLPPIAILASIYLVGLGSDLPATAIALLVAWRAFRRLGDAESGDAQRRCELRDLSLLAAAGVCIKLSTLVFLFGIWSVAALHGLRGPSGRRALGAALVAGALLLAPWLARGVVLSGYPLYPSAPLSLPVDWRVPAAQALAEAQAVKAWARVPGVPSELTLEGWYWLESWTRRHLRLRVGVGFPLPLLLGAAGLCAALLGRGRAGAGATAPRSLLLLAPAGIAFVFWFAMAPDPRFAMFVFWTIAATGIASAVETWPAEVAARAIVSIAALTALALTLVALPDDRVRAGPEHGFHALPTVESRVFTTASGLTLRVPVGTDQCWGTEQPCSPFPRSALRLRRAGESDSGFTLAAPTPAQR